MSHDEMTQFLRAKLRIEVKTESNYTGGMGGGDLYQNSHTIQLILDDEVISEISL